MECWTVVEGENGAHNVETKEIGLNFLQFNWLQKKRGGISHMCFDWQSSLKKKKSVGCQRAFVEMNVFDHSSAQKVCVSTHTTCGVNIPNVSFVTKALRFKVLLLSFLLMEFFCLLHNKITQIYLYISSYYFSACWITMV